LSGAGRRRGGEARLACALLWRLRAPDRLLSRLWAERFDLAGFYAGTIDLGGGPLGDVDSLGDIFVAKLDACGNQLWRSPEGAT
jgi:hypothetical protein